MAKRTYCILSYSRNNVFFKLEHWSNLIIIDLVNYYYYLLAGIKYAYFTLHNLYIIRVVRTLCNNYICMFILFIIMCFATLESMLLKSFFIVTYLYGSCAFWRQRSKLTLLLVLLDVYRIFIHTYIYLCNGFSWSEIEK